MKILFSKEAFEDLDKIENYLLTRWNDKVLEDFNQKLDDCLKLIIDGVAVFQNYEDTKYQKLLITKHNTLIYWIEDDTLKIAKILQNFQNPDENYDYLNNSSFL